MELKQIGLVHSPYKTKGSAPRQGKLSEETATMEIFMDYADAMKGIERLSHVIVLYWGDQANREILQSAPPWQQEELGVFSTRSPNRPNPIAFCVCKIINVEGRLIQVTGLDALDGSPILDIKGYSTEVDSYPEACSIRTGCHDAKK
ncbi:tRNA (N6-threonylcarbamoyladenosine(37)-N6)-methyltransferase TrmO [Sinanaerobacter sp. ZZT-01]|uniref:tRNA (N6-threonylcarbamoyladenosine(37)-N6)-methyltransferase TrmO n=1 Tax=Sinanaerobacter sp. ZZT-01 TaxID=3111540 RepID=UPI002D785BE8|nr:tRNA (N6-threonylcarbamoyladenosine(37)-N6)-methyltransferase TrmO [Sinanaerobacter sp. ZZT-01]WRR93431.1 tRNA (N6-threonylcarbamoyladenosine(37)-N6)-methyltransferase TrmO [Sinanaerobacter sp. ZZT-01]